MTKLKGLLLGTAGAVLLSSGAALAADPPRAPERTPVWACDITGFWELPGTDICFKVGGYAKADFIFTFEDFNSGSLSAGGNVEELNNGALDLVANARAAAGLTGTGAIAANNRLNGTGNGTGDQVRFTARQTRVNFDARTNTAYGTVRAFIEGDFYGGGGNETISNSGPLRLRHAFVQFGNLLAGQTWGTFMDLPSLADTIDFGGAGALSFTRETQIRWTQPLGNGISIVVAVENAENMDVRNAGLAAGGFVSDEFPDFVAKLVIAQEWGHVELGGVVRDMRGGLAAGAAAGLAPGIALEDTAGWAVMLSGRINVPVANGKDDIRFNAIYSDGGTRQFLGAALATLGNGGTEGVREWNARGQLIESWGVSLAYRHFWSDNLRTTILGDYIELDNVTAAASIETNWSILGNLIWSPVPRVDMGVEVWYQEVELLNGFNADWVRLQVGISRSF
jgi:porin-like protein